MASTSGCTENGPAKVRHHFIDELNGPRRMEVVWDGLAGRGYSEDEIERIMGRNLYRLYEEVIG